MLHAAAALAVVAVLAPQDTPDGTPMPAPPAAPAATTAAAYDPLAVPAGEAPSLALSFVDAERERTIPLRVYLPAATTPAPVIVWTSVSCAGAGAT